MQPLKLHELHQSLGASFGGVNGVEVVQHYGDESAEHSSLQEIAAVADLSYRGRVCVTGSDRVRFLNGQVTNNVRALHPGEGCYAALVSARGRMESDLHIHCLKDEFLLDFEPGLTTRVVTRLEKYLVADEVEVVDLEPHFGLLGVQGPASADVVRRLGLAAPAPPDPYESVSIHDATFGELVLVNLPRLGTQGFDLFVANTALGAVMDRLIAAAKAAGGGPCGWTALEMARIEAGVPRYGQDMDEANIPLEAGIEDRAIRYNKGCYIGQEVINRVHSVGRVTKSLCGLLLPDDLEDLPASGQKLMHGGKQVGYVTSSVKSARFRRSIALGYVRKEVNEAGTLLKLATISGSDSVKVVSLPFPQDLS